VPELDLLNGDATGSSGGQPRHEVEARVGYSNNGLGARLSVDWESGTHVDGALGGTSRLNFGSLATANLRLFANLRQMPSLVKNHPFLRGARVSIGIDNIFNTRRDRCHWGDAAALSAGLSRSVGPDDQHLLPQAVLLNRLNVSISDPL
jgi:hypothetical protein